MWLNCISKPLKGQNKYFLTTSRWSVGILEGEAFTKHGELIFLLASFNRLHFLLKHVFFPHFLNPQLLFSHTASIFQKHKLHSDPISNWLSYFCQLLNKNIFVPLRNKEDLKSKLKLIFHSQYLAKIMAISHRWSCILWLWRTLKLTGLSAAVHVQIQPGTAAFLNVCSAQIWRFSNSKWLQNILKCKSDRWRETGRSAAATVGTCRFVRSDVQTLTGAGNFQPINTAATEATITAGQKKRVE